MNFIPGKQVRLKHFAGKFCNKGEILESAGGIVTIKPEKSFTVFSFFEEDPIVVIYENEDKYFLSQCSIISIDYLNSSFNVIIEQNEEFNNRRKDERFPTSMYGVVVNSNSKETIFINNISRGGISIKTRLPLEIDQRIEIEATMDGNYVFIGGDVKWKKDHNKLFFEYGLWADQSLPEIDKILDLIKKDHFITVKNLKYEHAVSVGKV